MPKQSSACKRMMRTAVVRIERANAPRYAIVTLMRYACVTISMKQLTPTSSSKKLTTSNAALRVRANLPKGQTNNHEEYTMRPSRRAITDSAAHPCGPQSSRATAALCLPWHNRM